MTKRKPDLINRLSEARTERDRLSIIYGHEQARRQNDWKKIARPKRTLHGQGRGRRIRAAKERRILCLCSTMMNLSEQVAARAGFSVYAGCKNTKRSEVIRNGS